mmetsp:Transcript_41490/g.89090  ORF Transcript_41490/g.89090 Transcript_41490/m.89090 type:complete len:81 (+) Transcript_41490:176-418(+)
MQSIVPLADGFIGGRLEWGWPSPTSFLLLVHTGCRARILRPAVDVDLGPTLTPRIMCQTVEEEQCELFSLPPPACSARLT